jgi:hypothetical protein
MGEIVAEERATLSKTIERRLGTRGDPSELAKAYLIAAQRHALARTTEVGPVPTSLTVERSGLLLEISRELGRVIDDSEIEALFRVPRSQARSMRTTLLATYSDITDELSLKWALLDAKNDGRKTVDHVNGTALRFETEGQRDAFISQTKRMGYATAKILGDATVEWGLVVADDFHHISMPEAPKSQRGGRRR